MSRCVWFVVAFLLGLSCIILVLNTMLSGVPDIWLFTVAVTGLIEVFISSVGFFLSLYRYRDNKRKGGK